MGLPLGVGGEMNFDFRPSTEISVLLSMICRSPRGLVGGKQWVATIHRKGRGEQARKRRWDLVREEAGEEKRRRHGSGVVRCKKLARIFSRQQHQMETREGAAR